MLRLFKNIWDDDKGIALLTVVGVMAVATALIFGIVWYSEQALSTAGVVRSNTIAYQIASAGLDRSLADMQANGFNADRYPMTGSINGGTYTINVEPLGNTEYKVTSVGTTDQGATETLIVKFFYMNLWDMNFAAGSNQSLTAGGGGINGTSNVTGPFYVRGTIEMGGTSYIHDGPFFVKDGDIVLKGSSEVGESSNPIDVYVTGAYPSTNFYARSISQAVPSINLPTVTDGFMAEKYMAAKTESVDNIMGYPSSSTTNNYEADMTDPTSYETLNPPTGGTWTRPKAAGATDWYKLIDTDGSPASIGNGTANLVIGGTGSWGSWYGDGHTTAAGIHDDFAFDDVNNILYIEGTVYVDGEVHIEEDITYVGNGAIVANGDIYIEGRCIPNTVDLNPKEAVGFITPKTIYIRAGSSNKNPETGVAPDLVGAFFATEQVNIDNNIYIKGSVIAGSIHFGHPNAHLVTNPQLPSFLPESMPGKGLYILTKGLWTRPSLGD